MYGPELADRSAHAGLHEASRAAAALLFSAVRACQEAKLVGDGDPVHLGLTMWSTVHGLSLLILDRQLEDAGVGKSQLDAVIRTALATLRDGIVRAR